MSHIDQLYNRNMFSYTYLLISCIRLIWKINLYTQPRSIRGGLQSDCSNHLGMCFHILARCWRLINAFIFATAYLSCTHPKCQLAVCKVATYKVPIVSKIFHFSHLRSWNQRVWTFLCKKWNTSKYSWR